MNVVDSSAWLAYFADEPTAEQFSSAIEDTAALVVPVICIHEVFKVILRERGEEDALLAVAAMQQGEVVDLDSNLAIEAACLGILEKLAMADSIIFAVAQRYNATLWTQDHHFEGKPRTQYFPKNPNKFL